MNASGDCTFDFSRAVRDWCFVQLPLLDIGRLRNEAKTRGIEDLGLLAREPWEALDREDIFVPVAYARHGMWSYDQLGSLADGDIAVREEVGYRPWADLQEEAEEIPAPTPRRWFSTTIGSSSGWTSCRARCEPVWPGAIWALDSTRSTRFAPASASVPIPCLARIFGERAARWRAVELLLVRVQNSFFPFQRGGPRQSNWTGGGVPGLTDDAAQWAIDQMRSLDYAALAEECGVDAAGLQAAYEDLADAGLRIDPNAGLFDLIDQINRAGRERLSGAARLALDYYDAARILRSWHQRLTEGEPLPDIDELRGLNGTAVKERRYGTLNVRGNRAVIPIVLEEHGLYPWRVQLIGEGDSEIRALRVILDRGYHLDFDTLGIAVTDMGGSDIPANAELLLASFRGYANYFMLVFDNEGRAKELIEELTRAEVIEGVGEEQRKALREEAAAAAKQIGDFDARKEALRAARDRANDLSQEPGAAPEFVLWKEDFEADNFTITEMSQLLIEFSAEIGLEDFELEAQEIEAAVAEADKNGKAIASALLELAHRIDAGFVLSKPEFAERLALYALDNPKFEDGRGRPILDLAEQLVQLTWADRRLAGKLRD